MKIKVFAVLWILFASLLPAQVVRSRASLDKDWRFALGNAVDSKKDFGFDDGQLFFFAKAGKGNGPADPQFDDRAWQPVNLPHDWAVALPFDARGDGNHGSKAIGRNFPQNSIGWYRKTFSVDAASQGKRFRIDFDGVYRNSQVWLNGFYLGTESSGYASFGYDVTNYLNFDGPNTLVVRADATTDEGWFYEGAGIYRHVWLTTTAPVHVAHDGTYVTAALNPAFTEARVQARITVANDSPAAGEYSVDDEIQDADGREVAKVLGAKLTIAPGATATADFELPVASPRLWSLETPVLYRLVTTVRSGGEVQDRYETSFGIRQVDWTADKGFFLNGKHVEIKGTNDHQDAAGVGTALPDDLQVFRIERLKALGSNAIRTSHHPPTPELLDAGDRMGMLILDESRQMGTTPMDLDQLTRQIERDRNHPSVVIWSLGNEEWALEGSVYGTRLARDLTAYAKRLDPSRRSTVAMSGSSAGISLAVDVMGFNYYLQHDIDQMHLRFPERPIVGTEESSSEHTRGQYFDDPEHQHLVGYDFEADDKHASIEDGWRYYQARPYAAGLFYWTGFDYRGETTPFDWSAISSQFGLLDTCGFIKDTGYAAESFWLDAKTQPMVHLATTWTLPNGVQHGERGKPLPVLVYSNAAAVELWLNDKSLGRKQMQANSHLEWQVPYQPGTLSAKAFDAAGAEVARDAVETVSAAVAVRLEPEKTAIAADGRSLSIVTVRVSDAKGRTVPDAGNLVSFSVTGPGKIVGVGNGDPSSHEPDQYVASYGTLPVVGWRTKAVAAVTHGQEVAPGFDDVAWETVRDPRWDEKPNPPAVSVFRGEFTLPEDVSKVQGQILFRPFGDMASIYLNGHPLAENLPRATARFEYPLNPAILVPGKNVLTVYATKFTGKDAQDWTWYRGGPVAVSLVTPAEGWKRSVFHGLAQVIVQSTGEPGTIALTAGSAGLMGASVTLTAK
jgi:beta-galactosidase